MPEYDERDFNREDWGEEFGNTQPRILRDEVYGDPRDWDKKQARPGIIGMRSHILPGQIHGKNFSSEYIQARSDARRKRRMDALNRKLAESEKEEVEAEREIANEVLAGALQGDFNDNPTFWSDIGQIVTGLIPIAGQLGDIRDLVHILDDITNFEGYKKIGSWATLVLIAIGFIPGIGDGIKTIGKRGLGYLDNNRILKQMGEFLGENIIAPILNLVGDLTAPIVNQIKNAIRRKLDEAQEIARRLGEGADNVLDDVTGQSQPKLATEGAGNASPNQIDNTNQPLRGNEPMQMEGNSTASRLSSKAHLNLLESLGAKPNKEFPEIARGSTPFKSFANARDMARVRANLGEDAIPFLQEIGPHGDNIYTGMRSPDGSSGWRIDLDPQNPEKGFHVNWWFRQGVKRRYGWYSGAIRVEDGTQQDYWQIINHFPRKDKFIGAE